jgi:fibronectin-binding autotransporter adhesin
LQQTSHGIRYSANHVSSRSGEANLAEVKMQRRTKTKVIAAVAAASGSLFSVNAKAANYVWTAITAGNASGSWATATNWTPNLPGGATTTADTVNFSTLDITVPSTISLDGPKSVSVITFGDTDPVNTPAGWIINATSATANDATDTLNLLTTANPTFNVTSGTATINATIANGSPATWGLAKGGVGSLTLTANNASLTGFVYINNGTLGLDFSQSWSPVSNIIGDTSTGSASGSHLELQGGTLNLKGKAGASNSQTFSAGTNAGIGSASINFTQNGAASLSLGLGAITRATLPEAASIVKEPGATIDITLPTAGTVSGTTAVTGTNGLATDANGSPFITINGGSDWAAETGGNIVAGSSVAGFYTSSTSSTLAGNANLVTNTTLTTATTIASLRYNDTTARTLDLGGQSLTTGGILATSGSGGALTIQNGSLMAPNAAEADMIISQNNTTSPLTITANILNTATNGALTKTGAGTLILSGNNTYSGDTVVNGGTLSVTGGTLGIIGSPFSCTQIAPAFGNSATMNISGTAVVSDDHFDIAGNETNFAGGTGVLNQTGGTILNGAWFSVGSFGNGTYNFSAGSNTVEGGFASFEVGVFGPGVGTANISGTAQLNMWNNSVITMSDAGSTGNNTINQNGGTITMYFDGGTTTVGATGRVIIGGGGTGNDVYNLNGGTLTVPSIGRTSASGTGVLNLNGGTLRATGNSAVFINGLTQANVGAGGAIIDTGSFTVTVPQPLLHAAALGATPDLGLTKMGTGTLILSGAATYTGQTKVAAGILRLPSNVPTAPPTAVATYTFDTINGVTPVNGTELNPGDVVNAGGSGGAANNGTVNTFNNNTDPVSGINVVAGKFGHGLSFNGNGSSIDVANNIVDMSGGSTWTMSVWIQTSAATGSGSAILSKITDATTNPPNFGVGASVFYLGGAPVNGAVGTAGGFPTDVRNSGGWTQGGTAVADGTWHLVTYVDSAGTQSIYVDGSPTTQTISGFTTSDTSDGVRIGYNQDPFPDGDLNFNGNMDELQFYNAALSQQQIQDLFASNSISHSTPALGGQLLPSNTPVNLSVTGVTLDLNGNNQTIGSLTGVAGSSVLLGGGTLTTGGDNSTGVTYAGNISGTGGGLTKTGTGTFTLSGTNTYTGGTSVTGGTLVIGSAGALPSGTSLSIATNSRVNVVNHGANPKILLQVSSFTPTGTGTLDLSNNDMIVHGGVQANIFAELKAGLNAGTGLAGYWQGTGIVSSAAATNTRLLTTMGYRQSNGSAFDGVNTTTSDVLVKYTYYGDADLNGVVNGADYAQIDTGYGSRNNPTPLSGWSSGDFNYDGVIDGTDYSLIDNTFNQISAGNATPLVLIGNQVSFASPADISSVPEPTTTSVLALGAMGLMSRRRRKHV